MNRALAALGCLLASSFPAAAMVGGAQPAGEAGGAVVLIVGSHGTSCTGVALRTDLLANPFDELACDTLQFALRELRWIAGDTTFSTPERHVYDRGFPGHERRQRPHVVGIQCRMEAQATFGGSARRVVLALTRDQIPHAKRAATAIKAIARISQCLRERERSRTSTSIIGGGWPSIRPVSST